VEKRLPAEDRRVIQPPEGPRFCPTESSMLLPFFWVWGTGGGTPLDSLRPAQDSIDALVRAFSTGDPTPSSPENMDFYNSLQAGDAFRYLVCQSSDFALARRHNREFPQLRKGRQFS
jgi:hypothetical protein